MKVGMLWFDDRCEAEISERIEDASAYYRSKYGHQPNLCFVHPESIGEGQAFKGLTLKVKASNMLLQNHFWLGVEELEGQESG